MNALDGASPSRARRIMRRIARYERNLREDPDLRLVMDSLDRIVGPRPVGGAGAGVAAATPKGPIAFDQLQRGDVMLYTSAENFRYPWSSTTATPRTTTATA